MEDVNTLLKDASARAIKRQKEIDDAVQEIKNGTYGHPKPLKISMEEDT